MNSFTTNTISKSKHLVLSITLVLAAVLLAPRVNNAQQLQQGVSVQMAVTSNAAPMPDADNADAWIVTITGNGTVYLGIDPVTPAALADEMKSRLRDHQQRLYIKVDARAPYTNVARVLEAARTGGVAAPVLLTSQAEASTPGSIVPPEGLEVLVNPALPAGTVATVVELFNSRRQLPVLKINNDQIPWSALQSTLMQHFQKGDEKVILLKADVNLPFADVAHVIDECRSVDARVVLGTPAL